MKIDKTKTQVSLLYTYTGSRYCNGDNMYYCFELTDDYALVLELPWSKYMVMCPLDATRPLTVGDKVSIIYEHTQHCGPKRSWKPVDWYRYTPQTPLP